eukprot:10518056-Heterocapsa_arctica.AAC.1
MDLHRLMTESGKDFLNTATEFGFFPEVPTDIECHTCSRVLPFDGKYFGWKCTGMSCRKHITFLSKLPDQERDFWLPRLPLQRQVCALWCFTRDINVDVTTEITGFGYKSVLEIYHHFVNLVARFQTVENDKIRIG